MTLRPLLIVSLLATATALSQEAVPAKPLAVTEEMVEKFKISDAPLDTVLQILEQWTGRVILRPAALPTAPYTLIIDKPMPKAEAIRALETLLNHNQIGVTPMGERFLTVVPLPNLRTNAPRMLEGSALDLPSSGTILAKLFQLQFLRATEFVQQLGQFLNPQLGGPVVFDKTNAILVTDSVATLQRIEQLLLKLDKPNTDGITTKFYALRGGAKASAVVNQLRTMLQGVPQTLLGSATTYSSDDRTNQVILIADPRQHPFFDELIAKLDVQADFNFRNEVIPLKHANSKDVASVITQLVSGQSKATASGGAQSIRQGPMGPAPIPAAPGAAPAVQPQVQQALSNLVTDNRAEFSSLLTILSDERSNAVVVSGTADDIRLIRDLVEQLDILLAQVRIEVVIAEVTLGDNDATGISALGLQLDGDKLVGFNATLEGATIGGSAANSFATITRPGATGFVGGHYDLAGIIGLSTTPRKDNANLLSVPAISTTHNKEGRIFVGEQRPVISSYLNDGLSTGVGTSAGAGYRSTVTSKDIGIELKVKPLIGNDGSVQLDIKVEVNDILGDIVIDGNPQPNIGRRSTESFVSVRSNEIIVIAGLQRTTTRNATSRLGPIPFIGDLLGKRTRSRNRTDLLIFLRPFVLSGTSVDNAEAMTRVNASPQKDSVIRALNTGITDIPGKSEDYGSGSRRSK